MSRVLKNRKAREFFQYMLDRVMKHIVEDDWAYPVAVREKWIHLLAESGFPFKKSNGAMLFIPSDIVLTELLYSDMPMTLFFMKFAEFYLLLILLSERHPDLFACIGQSPCPVPQTLPRDATTSAERLLDHFSGEGRITKPIWGWDPVLFNTVRSLVNCRYLPLGMDYEPYNREIISKIQSQVECPESRKLDAS